MGGGIAPETVLRRALHLASLGRIDEAMPMIGGLLAEQPDNVRALQVLAYCLQRSGRCAEMLTVADRAVALDPIDAMNHRQRSRALVGLGRPREAVDAANEARRLDPHDVRSEVVLVDALLAAGGTANIGAAAAATARGRQLDPQSVDVYIAEGHVQRRMAEFDRACAAYRQALAIDPENTAALYWLGTLESDRGRALAASPVLGDTLQAAPTDRAAFRAALRGARRTLWVLTDLACVPLLLTAVLVSAWRDSQEGWAGVVGGLAILALGAGTVGAALRWRLLRLPRPTRTLIRTHLHRPTFAVAALRPVSTAVGGLLFALFGSDVENLALPVTLWPLLTLLVRLRNLLANEVYYAVRRRWFRLFGGGRSRPGTPPSPVVAQPSGGPIYDTSGNSPK